MMYYLGIDLGGTNVAAAVVNENGELLGKVSLPTPRGVPAEQVADQMAAASRGAVEQVGLSMDDIESVGIGSPGTIEPDTGVLLYCSKLDFSNVPLTARMAERLYKKN